eukprot:g11965.t1
MTNIGTTLSAIAHLHNTLTRIALQLEEQASCGSLVREVRVKKQVRKLEKCLPPLPHFTRFYWKFAMREYVVGAGGSSDGGGGVCQLPAHNPIAFSDAASPTFSCTSRKSTKSLNKHLKFLPGDMRRAFFLGYREENCEYLLWEEILEHLKKKKPVVGATFITPYPPGFPVVVPGQEINTDIVTFMRALDVSEVHGFVPGAGVKVFTQEALEKA